MKKNAHKHISANSRGIVYVLVFVMLTVFGWLAIHVKSGGTFLVDEEAFAITVAMRNDYVTLLMEGITFLGSSYFLVPANSLMILWLLMHKKNRLLSLQWAITSLGALFLMYFFKGFYERPRPLDPFLEAATGWSFPSGHTLNGLVFFALLIFTLWKLPIARYAKILWTSLLMILILGIGISRIYLRVHYASDVLGGLTLGTAWLAISWYIFRILERPGKANSH